MSNYDVRFTLRLTRELDAAMRAKAAETREDVSDFIRAAIRHSVLDYRAPSSADLADMRRLWREFIAVSRNINQMAHAANMIYWGKGGAMPEVAAMEAEAKRVYKLTYGIDEILRMWI
ncbi:plasmid mobilization protein [Magnetospirillum sulfuroxidans]|uniref:Plasmid mobilization relaxosome protein MobC n=1 Tax=Magnetospirillum sulfuroxidans TaxID=611300 RepID=A0ABS5IHC9_9PROT|nr:ribbon-helix-helix protein, CopG family [Magnetospirillum sulfuroxidans]MBR9973802.1 plasmid mobilization relaxosome protein MobC [Magnetospirillum sulfuroxidans]